MAESTLALSLTELEAEVGFYLGWGRGSNYSETAWSTRQQQGITDIIKSGLRSFYFPAPLPGESSSYDWSFLRPTRQATLESARNTVDLPDDFGGLEGTVFLVSSTSRPVEIQVTSEANVARQYAVTPSQTGTPLMIAIRNLTQTTQTRGSRSQLYVFPTADSTYTLEFRYYLLPDALVTTFPYPQGGTMHAETIRAACKAAAELHQDGQPGPMQANFIDRMRASVSLDRRTKGQNFGVVTDPGYNRSYSRYPGWRHYEQGNAITYDGANPG